ncbi:hypothetical protein ACQCVH_22220 [Bacillus infantis]|uniref:hypothetical protein n=1 Tax=Bacillus infantis TaxID=324767 RepID=UPI003CEDB129
MALYQWAKFHAISKQVPFLAPDNRYTTYDISDSYTPYSLIDMAGYLAYGNELLYKAATIDSSNNIVLSQPTSYSTSNTLRDLPNGTYYFKTGSNVSRIDIGGGNSGSGYRSFIYYKVTASVRTEYSKGSFIEYINAEYNAYTNNARNSDGWWYERQGLANTAPSTPGAFTSPASGMILKGGETYNFAFGVSTDAEGPVTYELQKIEYSAGDTNIPWVNVDTSLQSNQKPYTITSDKTKNRARFRVRSKDSGGLYSPYSVSPEYEIVHNAAPTLTLNMSDSQTLYEASVFTIEGNAVETDNGNVLSVKYEINNGPYKTIDAKVSDGSTPLTFSKQLTFRQGFLYDGENIVSGELAGGVEHTLTVWSEDDQNGKSPDTVRTFFVVPNRAPELVFNAIEPISNSINAEKLRVTGSVTDPEGDVVKLSYLLNSGEAVVFYEDVPGEWSFDIDIKDLAEGSNPIEIEAEDIYGAKDTELRTITKTKNSTPQKAAVAIYEITPPAGSAQEVIAWIQREIGDLGIEAEISMTGPDDQENFVPMTLTNSAPVGGTDSMEDEFGYQATEAKSKIILKLKLTREDTTSPAAINLISGVLE